MAETDVSNYANTLQQVLLERKDWLDRSELPKLKENLRTFHTAFASLYGIYLKKKLIDEDPYKQETKINELEVPDSSAIQETKRVEQLSIRLSNYDNQLDFLVNFYQLGMDFLNLERLKRILGLIRYIDWAGFSPDSQSGMTKAVAEITAQSKAGADTLALSIIGESVSKLSKMTAAIMTELKNLNIYYRESYKLSLRQKITQSMSAGEANLENIKKKMPAAMPGSPLYKELIEEVIKEDYSNSGADMKDSILNQLKVPTEKQKAQKAAVNYKAILMDGIQVIGGASVSLNEIASKFDENQTVLESKKKGLFHAIKELIRQITNAEPEEVIYNLEYLDQAKGVLVKEQVNYHQLRDDMDKKSRILASFVKGAAYNKLSAMPEDQIIRHLENNIRDVQTMHKTFNALDDFFKSSITGDDKAKGIKPELSALKNTIVKANQLKYEYSAQKEEEDQMKRLGLNPTAPPPQQP